MDNIAALKERIRAARESMVEAGGFRFKIKRPDRLVFGKVLDGAVGKMTYLNGIVLECVVGWEDVKLSDILPGESDDAAPFDAELFALFIADRPGILDELSDHIGILYAEHEKQKEDAAKN